MDDKIVAVSGGFDPLHIGHLRMMQEAKKLGHVVAIVHSNDWLVQKKGYYFMDEQDRCEIIRGLSCVDEVYLHPGIERNAGGALEIIRPDIFANGGDRNETDALDPNSTLFKDVEMCNNLGIEMVFNVGGGKIRSSSEMTNARPKEN